MKKCLRCQKDFEPKNPKGKFCSDKCRVYWNRVNAHAKNVKRAINEVAKMESGEKPKTSFEAFLKEMEGRPQMPKGLSVSEQLEWRSNNP